MNKRLISAYRDRVVGELCYEIVARNDEGIARHDSTGITECYCPLEIPMGVNCKGNDIASMSAKARSPPLAVGEAFDSKVGEGARRGGEATTRDVHDSAAKGISDDMMGGDRDMRANREGGGRAYKAQAEQEASHDRDHGQARTCPESHRNPRFQMKHML